MDTAFINRVGITSGWGYASTTSIRTRTSIRGCCGFAVLVHAGWPRSKRRRQRAAQVTGVRMQFTRQGLLRFDRFEGFETWAGQRFDRGTVAHARQRAAVSLAVLEGQYFVGQAVFYDPDQPFQGRRDGGVGFTLQPSGRLSQAFRYRRVVFDRAVDRRAASTTSTSLQPDDLSVLAPVLHPRHRPVRQLTLPGAHRLLRRTSRGRARSSTPATAR